MNISCIICSDTIIPTAEVYATTCGHLFHYSCLIQWLERSKTCPQCRDKVTEKLIHRIYLNLTNTDHIYDDVGTLQNKIDNLQFELTLKEKDVKIFTEKYKKVKHQNLLLREEVASLENKMKVHDSIVAALKDQILYFKSHSKERDRLTEELTKVKNRLKEVELLQTAVSGTREELDDMLKNETSTESLVILVNGLKKALLDSEKKKTSMEQKVKQLQHDVAKYRIKVNSLDSFNQQLSKELQTISGGKEHKKGESPIVKDTSFESKRIHKSSGLLHKTLNDVTSNVTESPPVAKIVEQVLNSDSPYLPVQSNNLNIVGDFLKGENSSRIKKPNMSIFKKSDQEPGTPGIRRDNEIVYNGLGGQSKEEKFPTAENSLLGSKRQRPHSLTNTSIAKCRKVHTINLFKRPK